MTMNGTVDNLPADRRSFAGGKVVMAASVDAPPAHSRKRQSAI
jgi:hypothetical protein